MASNTLEDAIAHHRSGRLEQAEATYRAVLADHPNHGDALHLLGGLLVARGLVEDGIALIRRAIAVAPAEPLFRTNLAGILSNHGQAEQALELSREALALKPGFCDAHNQAGIALHHLGRFAEAKTHYEQALALDPARADVLNNLGNACKQAGESSLAETKYRRALALRPGYGEAIQNLASLYMSQGRAAEAEALLAPIAGDQQPERQNLLGQIYQLQGKTAAARSCYGKAITAKPEKVLWQARQLALCPVIPPSPRAIQSWRKRFMQGVARLPRIDVAGHVDELQTSHAQLPYHLAYQGEDNLTLKQAYAARFFNGAAPAPPMHPDGPPRIAFLVTAGHEGIFLKCTRGILQHWRGRRAAVTLIAPETSLTIIRPLIDNPRIAFMPLHPRLSHAVTQIRARGFDLVYFWEIGSDGVNGFLPWFRLAPVQCTSWGTADTTGLPDVDVYLSCRLWEDESARGHYCEDLRLLERVPTCYQPPRLSPDAVRGRDHFGLSAGERIYLCAQNLFKLHPDFDDLILGLLQRDPNGRVLLVEGKQSHWTELLRVRLGRTLGALMDRVRFLSRLDYDEYLSLIKVVDVLLDSLYFSGGNTSYEGLAMGTPIITLPGKFIRGRFTLGCYRTMGMDDGIAQTRDEFWRKAISIAGDPDRRRDLSQRILDNGEKLFNRVDAALEFEDALCDLAQEAAQDSSRTKRS